MLVLFSVVFLVFAACSSAPSSENNSGETETKQTSSSNSATADPGTDNFPNRPITFIHPYGTGGSADLLTRTIGEGINKLYPEFNFVITSMPGGGTNVALNHLMTQPADGYSIMMNVEHSVLGYLTGTTEYSPDQYETILGIYQAPTMIYIHESEDRFRTWEELVEYLQNNDTRLVGAAGGIDGIYGVQISDLLATFDLNEENLILSEYPESAERFAAFSGGHVDLLMQKSDTITSYVEEGEYIPIISFAPDRIADFPDVPTALEFGAPESTSYLLPFGFIMPNGVPEDVVNKINKVFREYTESEEFQQFLEEQNAYEVKYGDDYHQDMLNRMEVYKEFLSK